MTLPYEITILDSSDTAAVAEYERAFYAAFQRATANRLVRTLWKWDHDERRLATRIPYEDQTVYLARDCGAILAAIAVNIAMRDFQAAAFGFQPPERDAAEVLTLFSTSSHDLRSKIHLFERALADLRASGRRIVVATTAERPLRVYLRIGWQLIGEVEIEGERRYFLHFDLVTPSIAPAVDANLVSPGS